MKTCFKCNIEKPLEEFYRHSGMKDGRLGKCTACARKDAAHNYRGRRVQYQKYEQKRNQRPGRKAARKAYAAKMRNDPNFARKQKEARQRYVDRNPLKRAAHVTWGNHRRNLPDIERPCARCSSVACEAHHEDYRKPLEVIWLCTPCHGERHREINLEILNGVDWTAKGFHPCPESQEAA